MTDREKTMTDRERVMKGLKQCLMDMSKDEYETQCEDCPYFDPELTVSECKQPLLYDALALLKAQEPGWISVKDRLPEDNRFVLVCNDDGHMMIAQYVGEERFCEWQYKYTNYDVDVWDDEEQGPVCWWMPLPEAPKEEPC